MTRGSLKHRVEQLERKQLAPRPSQSIQFDEDALAIYGAMSYLDATLEPSYHDVEPTAVYVRGTELRDALYGPIIPAHLDEHLKRYTRASGEFELAFGREPETGDMLRYEHVALMHSSENYSRQFGRVIEAWQRQLPQLTCPLKFEGGRLLRRLAPVRQSEAPRWEEDVRIQPEMRWLEIPEVLLNTDIETMLTIPAVTFIGVVDVKHQCRPATYEELQRAEAESPITGPTGFMFGRQRFYELLVEVMGA
jgi:hypothetical protein